MLFPSKKVTLHTKLKPDDIRKKLKTIAGGERYVANPFIVDKPYYGGYENNTFEIQKVRTLIKNDFTPVIKGKVTEQEECSVVDIEMKLRLSTSISMGAIMLIMLVIIITARGAPTEVYLFLAAVYIVPTAFFQFGAIMATRRLRDVFEAT